MKRILFTILAAGLFVAESGAAQFAPNHLFVGCKKGRVVEFDPYGNYVATHQVAPSNQVIIDVEFGPDGALYYIRDYTTVGRYAADGANSTVLSPADGLSSGVFDIDFGPDGYLYVADTYDAEIMRWRPAMGSASEAKYTTTPETFSLNNNWIYAIEFGPEGTMHMVDVFQNGVHLFNPDFEYLRERASSFANPTVMCFGANGIMFVGNNNDEIKKLSLISSPVYTSSEIDGIGGMTVGPDERLYVSSFINNKIVIMSQDGVVETVLTHSQLELPLGLAFAPFRFKATVKVSNARNGQPLTKARDKRAVLSIAPGSRKIMLSVEDEAADADDAGSALRSAWHVFRGREIIGDANARKRHFMGNACPVSGLFLGTARIDLTVKGAQDAAGIYTPTGAKGQIGRDAARSNAFGRIRATKLLN